MAEGPTLASLDAGNTSVADDMRAILKEAGGIETSTLAETATKPEPVAPNADDKVVDDGDNVDRGDGRNSKGRWVRSTPEPGTEAAKAKPEAASADTGKEKAVSKPENGGESAEGVEDDDLDPPHDWTLDQQTEFRKLPMSLKTLILASDRNGREVAAERGRYQALDSVFAPRRQALAMQGYTDDVAVIKAMFAYSDYIDQHPTEFIQQLMDSKGLQFDTGQTQQPGNGAQPDPNDPDFDDPVIKKLQGEITRLNGVVNQITQGQQDQVQAQRQMEISEAASALTAFRDEKDEKGRLKHPYMTEPRIRKAMSAMLRAGLAPNHIKAYDMACRADPDVNAKIAAAAEADRERARALEARKKAEAAQRAGSSITGTPAGPIAPELKGKSAREDLRQVAAEMGFRFGG